MRSSLALKLLLLTCMVSACTASLPQPTAADAEHGFSRVGLDELKQGRVLYIARCGGCHALRDPASEPAAAWSSEVHEMRTKHGVALSDEEERRISAYLIAIASR